MIRGNALIPIKVFEQVKHARLAGITVASPSNLRPPRSGKGNALGELWEKGKVRVMQRRYSFSKTFW